MAYDEKLADRVRRLLRDRAGVDERKMFGGLAFLLEGKMCCGVLQDELMVRVGPQAHDAALREPHARPMDFTGRPMRGMVYVAAPGLDTPARLARWVERGIAHAASLPAKPPTRRRRR